MSDDMAVAEDRAQRFEDAHPPLMMELTDDEGERVDVPTERLPRLLWWHILLRPFVPPKKTKGGLLLPDQVDEANQFHVPCYQILQLGPLAFTHPRLRGVNKRGSRRVRQWHDHEADAEVETWAEWEVADLAEGQDMPKVGDWVLIKRHSGARYKINGASLLVINDDDIIGAIDSPTGWASYIA